MQGGGICSEGLCPGEGGRLVGERRGMGGGIGFGAFGGEWDGERGLLKGGKGRGLCAGDNRDDSIVNK